MAEQRKVIDMSTNMAFGVNVVQSHKVSCTCGGFEFNLLMGKNEQGCIEVSVLCTTCKNTLVIGKATYE